MRYNNTNKYILNNYNKYTLILLMTLALYSCNKFEYSPYDTNHTDELPNNLNELNLSRIKSQIDINDTLTIIYTGDSQRFYADLDNLIAKANSLNNIDFLVICGDIADFGIREEYVWITERLKNLNIPYLCVIGNHDLVYDEGELYTSIFGPKNFSLTYGKYKFLFHDTNGREYGFNGSVPNLWWLTKELKDTVPNYFVGVSHVPPYDADFDPVLEIPYKDLLASKNGFLLSLHGHLHGHSDHYFYNDSVRYMTSNSVNKDEFVVLKFINGNVIKSFIKY